MTCCNEDGKSKEEATVLPDWKRVLVSRTEFLKMLCLAAGGVMGLLVAVPGATFILSYLFRREPREWLKIGAVEKFKEGETVSVLFDDPYGYPWEGITRRRSAWLRRVGGDSFIAFAINCTHLGCPVRWEAGADLFLCPCHGGVYNKEGDVVGGPPPQAMHRYDVRVVAGQVEIKAGPVLMRG